MDSDIFCSVFETLLDCLAKSNDVHLKEVYKQQESILDQLRLSDDVNSHEGLYLLSDLANEVKDMVYYMYNVSEEE